MSLLKKTLAAGLGASAAVVGAGALIYECGLNTRLNRKFVALFDKPDPKQDAMYDGDLYGEGQRWFRDHKGEDKTITTQKTGRIHAYIIPAENAASHRWAVCCHGYNSAPSSTALFAKHFHEQGFHCVCPSLRGWGNDETHYCSMGYRDKDLLLAWIDYIVAMDPEAEILLHGYSMGSVTVMLATGEALPANVKAAVCDCGFTTCTAQFRHVLKTYTPLPSFPLFNAVNLVSTLRGNFNIRKNNPIEAIRHSVTPTVFLHGTADTFVPFYMMDELYEACAAPKAKQPIEGGLHATAVVKDPDTYWKAVDAFLKDYI